MSIHTDEKARTAMEALQRPFPPEDIEWRVSRSGIKNDKPWALVLAYITARAVHERMDEVFGIGGWRNTFREFTVGSISKEGTTSTTGVICRLEFIDPSTGDWCWKENGAAETDIEPFKGGLSGSEKRAFEELGGGRYLYRLTETFAVTSLQKSDATPHYAKTKDGKIFCWGPPALPPWALPEGEAPEKETSSSASSEVDGSEEPAMENEAPAQTPTGEIYPNLALPSLNEKGMASVRSLLERAGQLGWSLEKFTAWRLSTISVREFSNINAAQAMLLLQRLKTYKEEPDE